MKNIITCKGINYEKYKINHVDGNQLFVTWEFWNPQEINFKIDKSFEELNDDLFEEYGLICAKKWFPSAIFDEYSIGDVVGDSYGDISFPITVLEGDEKYTYIYCARFFCNN